MAVPPYRLETFGKLRLAGGASAGASHQRRRLALLALLATSGDRGMSRDELLGYLWPESSSTNARHSLEQLLHAMRRALGEAIFVQANPVCLNPEVITSDVADFVRALASGSLAEAAELYKGPFLQGFYLEEAAEFERWASTERGRLATRYSEAVERLANEAEKNRNYAAAIRWRRLLSEADPLSSRSALALMRTLAASGDRTAALQHARRYEAVVQQELESRPDPSITAYAATLRAGGGVDPLPDPVEGREAEKESPAVAPHKSIEPLADAPSANRDTTRDRRRNWLPAILAAAAILVAVGFSLSKRETPAAVSANRIVVVPFRTTGDSSAQYLQEGVVDLIAPMLNGEGGPLAVDSRTAINTWKRVVNGRAGTLEDARRVAQELGAPSVLTGAVVESGGTLTITGTLVSADGSDTQPLTSVTGPADSVNKLLSNFVGQVLARTSGISETSIFAVTSQSLPAIRAYLAGRAAYRLNDEDRAIKNFSRALDIDSTFALAALDLVVATGKLLRSEICRGTSCRVYSVVPGYASSDTDDDLFRRGIRIASENRSKLGRRDSPLLDALMGSNYPRASSARQTVNELERAVRVAPDRPEALNLLGTLLLYQGRAIAITDWKERADAAFREALRLDSTYLGPLVQLVDEAAFENDTSGMRLAAQRYLARDSVSPTADYVRWVLRAGTKAEASKIKSLPAFNALSRVTLEHIVVTAHLGGFGLADADSIMRILVSTSTDPLAKSIALRRAELFALNRGRPHEGAKLLQQMAELRAPGYTFMMFAIASALYNDGEKPIADSSARALAANLSRDTLRATRPDDVRRISVAMSIQSLWDLANGDTTRAVQASDWVKRHLAGQPRNRVFAVLPQMLLDSHAKRPEAGALRALVDAEMLNGCCEIPEFISMILARAYEESGDDANALRVIRRGVWYAPSRLLAPQLREEGRLSVKVGDRAGAIRAYEHYLALRSDPEPSLRGERDRIRAEVARLKANR